MTEIITEKCLTTQKTALTAKMKINIPQLRRKFHPKSIREELRTIPIQECGFGLMLWFESRG